MKARALIIMHILNHDPYYCFKRVIQQVDFPPQDIILPPPWFAVCVTHSLLNLSPGLLRSKNCFLFPIYSNMDFSVNSMTFP
jgi:hypothetical protein